jgi:ribosomal protein S18 acetylase RimI-like enzyme
MDLNLPECLVTRDGVELALRPLCLQDRKALQTFNADLSDESRRVFLPHAYDDATVDKALTRSEAGDDLTLGLFAGDRLVGYFFLWYFTRPVPLLGIGLVDDFQGRGLGRPMMNVLLEAAKQSGRDGVDLTTCVDNERAFALYQKVGFEYYADVKNKQGQGKWVIERAMFYRIKPDAQPMQEPHQPPV